MNVKQRRMLARNEIVEQVERVQKARRELNFSAATWGLHSAAVTRFSERVKEAESKLIEMTLAYFGGEQ